MSEDRMVSLLQKYGTEKMIVNSAADWGVSDPLKVPKTAAAMLEADFLESDVQKVMFDNPIEFFAQSGRISKDEVLDTIKVDQSQLWQENSALRGQEPKIEK
jgi:hypothetical protein